MKLIVGLGNPGRKYRNTRHNIGFDVAAKAVQMLGGPSIRSRFSGELAEAMHEGRKVAVLCPETYMNASGRSVRQAIDFYKLDPAGDDLLVICDDMNLPVGRLRFRSSGSAGGQKGLADIISHLGSDRFSRLRIGIDRPHASREVTDYVLSPFTAQERDMIGEATESAAAAVLDWTICGIHECMNRYNAGNARK